MHVVMKLISPIAKMYMYRDDEEEFVIFQQDGASAHHSKKVQDWLDIIFEDRWMGRAGPISWSARSPDLTPLDFWLWGICINLYYIGVLVSVLLVSKIMAAKILPSWPRFFCWDWFIHWSALTQDLLATGDTCKQMKPHREVQDLLS